MLAILTIHFSGSLLIEDEGTNQTYLFLKKWAEQLSEGYEALKPALSTFLDAYPNLYEAGDEVDWEDSDWCVAPLKARLSEMLAAVSAVPGAEMPATWTEVLSAADRIIEAFHQRKLKADAEFLKRARAGAARQAATDRQNPMKFAKKQDPLESEQPILSAEEEDQFVRHGFKSRLPVRVTGRIEGTRNIVSVGNQVVPLPDSEFLLFLRLVLAVFSTADGFIPRTDFQAFQDGLNEAGAASEIDHYLGRLRSPFIERTGQLRHTDFIETLRGRGRYRISTHRKFIEVDCDALLRHPDDRVRQLAGLIKEVQEPGQAPE